MGLVIEARRKIVSFRIGVFESMSTSLRVKVNDLAVAGNEFTVPATSPRST